MKPRTLRLLPALVACALIMPPLKAQNVETHRSKDGKYTYTTVTNDPLKARFYTLKNGLTVIMSVNKAEPRLQTMIATRAGSKNDPSTNTGLAHYLEHLLFKGTDKFGTKDYAKEKVLLAAIEGLYEEYNKTKDEAQRKTIYRRIDSVSGEAAKYAIANEYDKLMGSIGATGTNAFTSTEQTVYLNDIPQNQLDKWLTIEAERFRNPVLRLFHTELEAVYEEKNISLDNDGRKVMETALENLFRNHAYGTQTTIGTVEHLKNPSLKEIQKYYETYYVPNNMAIVLAGDFDPDQAIAMIDNYFGYMKPKPVPQYTFKPETPRNAPVIKTVHGPDAENAMIVYRFPGAGTRESMLMELTDLLLAYKTAGLIDLNLKKQQKVLDASSYTWVMKDYSMHFMTGRPKQGQSLDEVRDLLLGQLDLIRQGKFEESDLKAIIRNLKVDQIKQYEANSGRAYTLLDAFVLGQDWKDASTKLEKLGTIRKNDIVEFVNRHYGNDYVVVNKKIGDDKSIVKVDKPEITPVAVNRDDESPFVKNVLGAPAPAIKPVFLDYKRDISTVSLKNNVPMHYLHNDENGLFSLYYVFDMGKNNDKKLPFAIKYLQYLGTNKLTAEQLSKEFFKLGCEFGVSAGDDQVYVSLSGLQESYEHGLRLFEEFLANAKPDQTALDNMVASELKSRVDAKRDKRTILWSALRNFATYGRKNPFTDRLSAEEMQSIKAEDLVSYIKSLNTYKHRVLFYGPMASKEAASLLNKYHTTPSTLKPYPAAVTYNRSDMKENVVYFVNYDMVQAEILWLNKSGAYDPGTVPLASMFNEYFGGSMSSVVFQTIRESKALAYSTFARYSPPAKKEDPFYMVSYVGTQADKINEAIPAMNDLLTTMPKADRSFTTARDALKNQIETERITKTGIMFNYLSAEKLGLDHDIRQDVYNQLTNFSLTDLEKFHALRIKNKPYAYCVVGSKEKINIEDLRKHGQVVELTLEDIFGY